MSLIFYVYIVQEKNVISSNLLKVGCAFHRENMKKAEELSKMSQLLFLNPLGVPQRISLAGALLTVFI